MKKVFYTVLAACVAFSACEKMEEAAKPQAYKQEEARTLPTTFAVNAVSSIDLNMVEEEMVQVATLGTSTLPEDASYGPFTIRMGGLETLAADKDLKVSKEALQQVVLNLLGPRPVERTIPATVYSTVQVDGQGFRMVSNDFDVKVTPIDPKLEAHYYYLGSANNWSTTDKTYEFKNASGEDYYDDPVISVTIPAPVDEDTGNRIDNWFKVAPGSAYERDNFWDGNFIGADVNGKSDWEGEFVIGNDKEAFAFNVGAASDEYLFYTITLDLAKKTYKVEGLTFPENLYMLGSDFGNWDWNSEDVVTLTKVGGGVEGQFWTIRYLTANHGIKFNSARSWDGNQFGSLGTNEGFTNDGDGNVVVAESGAYMIHIDLKRNILHLEPARVYGTGACFGNEWGVEKEEYLFTANGDKLQMLLSKGGKLRMFAASTIANTDWWTREFNIYDGQIVYRGTGGDQPDVPVLKAQTVVLDFNAGTGVLEGEGEVAFAAELTVPGNWTGSAWDETAPKLAGDTNGLFKGALVMTAESGVEFKFMHEGSWIGGTTVSEYNYTLGSNDNMSIAAGTYLWTVDLVNNTAVALPVTKVGLIGSFNSWADDVVLTFNETNLTYTGNVTLAANDKLKVRFNGDWGIPSLGGSLEKLSAFGGDIVVADAGTYAVVLDLNASTLTLTPAN